MNDYSFYVSASWGFAVFVLIVLFAQSWRRLAAAEKRERDAQKG